jgi:hypothetical protein
LELTALSFARLAVVPWRLLPLQGFLQCAVLGRFPCLLPETFGPFLLRAAFWLFWALVLWFFPVFRQLRGQGSALAVSVAWFRPV